MEWNAALSLMPRLAPSLALALGIPLLFALAAVVAAGPSEATLDFVRASSDTRLRNAFSSAGYVVVAGTLGGRVAIVATCMRQACGELPTVPGVAVVEREPLDPAE